MGRVYWWQFPETEFRNEFRYDQKLRPVVVISKQNYLDATVIVAFFGIANKTDQKHRCVWIHQWETVSHRPSDSVRPLSRHEICGVKKIGQPKLPFSRDTLLRETVTSLPIPRMGSVIRPQIRDVNTSD